MNSDKKSNKHWSKIVPTKNLAKEHLERAFADLESSKILYSHEDYDWAFSVSYNAMLQASEALMSFNKVRSKGPSHHISILKFLRENYKDKLGEDFLFVFDKYRKKRHLAIYGVGETISEKECENCIKICEDFVEKVKEILKNE